MSALTIYQRSAIAQLRPEPIRFEEFVIDGGNKRSTIRALERRGYCTFEYPWLVSTRKGLAAAGLVEEEEGDL